MTNPLILTEQSIGTSPAYSMSLNKTRTQKAGVFIRTSIRNTLEFESGFLPEEGQERQKNISQKRLHYDLM
jgi:hypothetical protein